MNRCNYCKVNLRFWNLTCAACKNNVMQAPQITFFSISLLVILAIPISLFVYIPSENSEIYEKEPEVKVDFKPSKARQQAARKLSKEERRERRKQRRLQRKQGKQQKKQQKENK